MRKMSVVCTVALCAVLSPVFAAWQPGLQWGSISGSSMNTTDFPAVTNVSLSIDKAKTSGWPVNTTYVYWGKIYLDGSVYRFGENIDDNAMLKINGEIVFNNTTWNVASFGIVELPEGWYDFDLRMHNANSDGGVSSTANGGFSSAFGFGYTKGTLEEVGSLSDASTFVVPEDPGDVSFLRYDDGKGFEDTLIIVGEPKNIGEVSPAYGQKPGLKDGDNVDCRSVSPSPYTDATGSTWTLAGYEVYDIDIATGTRTAKVEGLSGSGSSFSYTHGTTMRELVWKWTATSHTISVQDYPSATITGAGAYDNGVSVTISVTELPPSSTFYKWTGNLPKGIDVTSETVTFTADASYTFIPSFAATCYVSNNGNSTEPYASWETAATNIEDAVAFAQRVTDVPAKILIDEGDYKITKLPYLNITNPLQIIGKGADKTRISTAYKYVNSSGNTFSSLRRHFHLSHADALLEGVTIRDGNWQNWDVTNQAKDGEHYDLIKDLKGVGGVYMSAGTIRNCHFTANTGNDDAGAIYVDGGIVTNCVFYGNKAYRGNNNGAARGATTINGGLMVDCVISNNEAWCSQDTYGTGGGALVSGNGVLRNSLIIGNKAGDKSNGIGAGVSIIGNGLVENCVISNNWNAKKGGGVYLNSANATLRNCLVTHNTAEDEGGGVWLKNGKVEFCTVSENTSSNAKGSGLYCENVNAQIKGNILYGNGVDIGSEPICNFAGTQPTTYTMNVVSPAGNESNIDSDPLFTDPNHDDFTPGPGSPAIDGYKGEGAPAVDITLAARPKDGDGNGTSLPDIGCYEAGGVDDGPLRGTISISETEGYDSLTTTLTANLAGAGKENVTYEWDLGGGSATGDASGATVTAAFTKYGAYHVSLKVTPASGVPMTLHLAEPIRVGSQNVWVGNGSGIWPYSSKETATNDVCEAVSSALVIGDDQVEIIVTDGNYEIKEKWVSLTANIYLHGENGKEKAILYGNHAGKSGSAQAALYIAHAGAVVSDLTITNCNWDGNVSGIRHGAVNLLSGTIRDCTLTRLRGGNQGGALTLANGIADNLLIYDCESSGNSNPNVGEGVVYISGAGILKNSVISNNCAMVSGGGVYLNHKDGVVSNCVIVGNATGRGVGLNYRRNERQLGKNAGGVQIGAGLMINCFIEGNYATGTGGGVRMTGSDSRMVNCVIAENAAKVGEHGVRMEDGATIINGTIVNNGANASETVDLAGAGLSMTNGTSYLKNTIVYHNVNSAKQLVVSEANLANVTNSCAPELTVGVNCNISADPQFRNLAKGDYSLKSGSHCINAGNNDLNTSAKDIIGNDRIFRRIIDIGAYESQKSPGSTIILR